MHKSDMEMSGPDVLRDRARKRSPRELSGTFPESSTKRNGG